MFLPGFFLYGVMASILKVYSLSRITCCAKGFFMEFFILTMKYYGRKMCPNSLRNIYCQFRSTTV